MGLNLSSDVNQLHTLAAELRKEKNNYEVELRLPRERIKQSTHQFSLLLPKSISSPSLPSHVLVGKFCDSLPFYRQKKQFHIGNLN